MRKLSRATQELVQRIFPPEQQAEAVSILEKDCADNLPLFEKHDEQALETVRFAVMKLSQGHVRQLDWWVGMARHDPQDVIAAAFGKELNAYRDWARAVYYGTPPPASRETVW